MAPHRNTGLATTSNMPPAHAAFAGPSLSSRGFRTARRSSSYCARPYTGSRRSGGRDTFVTALLDVSTTSNSHPSRRCEPGASRPVLRLQSTPNLVADLPCPRPNFNPNSPFSGEKHSRYAGRLLIVRFHPSSFFVA